MNAITKTFSRRTVYAFIFCLAASQAIIAPAYAEGEEPENAAPPTMVLRTGSDGHYYTDGKINGKDVNLLVDTGASAVVIPEAMADELGLDKTRPIKMASASDVYAAYETIIPDLEVGPIHLSNVVGNINPKATGNQILLGMSALKSMKLIQENGKMTLRGISEDEGAGAEANLSTPPSNASLDIKIHVRDCIGASKIIDRNALECIKGLKPSSEVKAKELSGPTASSANPRQLLAAQ